eukprot:GFUD01137112.1.p1 GENE.GFUD01137112.1~~GFUD01137112.1.p1  ORF type:complete len:444 (+),score=110.86 GFUD01137112.1:77-1408(+)
MCSSDSEAELSLSLSCGLSGPGAGTRKSNIRGVIFSHGEEVAMDIEEEGDNEFRQVEDDKDSKENVIVVNKKRDLPNSTISAKATSNVLVCTTSTPTLAATSTAPPNFSPMPGIMKSSDEVTDYKYHIVVELKDAVSIKPESDYNCNIDLKRPVSISTPEQINSRTFDQNEFMNQNSIPCNQIVEDHSQQFTPSSSPSFPPREASQNTTPVPNIILLSHSHHLPGVTTSQTDLILSQAQGQGRSINQALPIRPCLMRQPSSRLGLPLRQAGAPRMLRPPGPRMPRNSATVPGHYRAAGKRPSGPVLPSIRSITPIKRRSLSTPQYSSQCLPPVVALDTSPPADQTYAISPPNSVVNKLTSMGVSVIREKVPSTKHGWVLPPGLSVTKTTSNRVEEGPSLSLPSLAKVLTQLGQVDGRKRLVQFQLTEAQVRALDTFGIKEEEM